MMTTRTTAAVPHVELFPAPRSARGPFAWLATVADDARQLVRYWPVVQNLVIQDLRVRYQRSVLGFFWTLLNPMLMMLTMTFFFSHVMKMNYRDYAVYLFAGMVPWTFFHACLSDCAFCIINSECLIRKIYLPKLVFPLARVLVGLTTFVLSMVALFLLMKPIGARFTPSLLALPLAVALLAVFAMGLGLVVATMNTFFRDCGHLVAVFLQAWYFATPIIYKPQDFSPDPQMQRLFWLNPAYAFVRLFQVILSDGRVPDLSSFLVAAGIATVCLGVGYATFKCHEDKLVFRL